MTGGLCVAMRTQAAHFYDIWLICNLIRMLNWSKQRRTPVSQSARLRPHHRTRNNKYCHKYDTENSINGDGDDGIVCFNWFVFGIRMALTQRPTISSSLFFFVRFAFDIFISASSSSSVHCRWRFWETKFQQFSAQLFLFFSVVRCSMCDADERSLKWYACIRTTPTVLQWFSLNRSAKKNI